MPCAGCAAETSSRYSPYCNTHLGRLRRQGAVDQQTVTKTGLASYQRLVPDVQARRIDVIVVVYKVDRLTRSLADFAKLVETFAAHGVSFVSVTQSFNTNRAKRRSAACPKLTFITSRFGTYLPETLQRAAVLRQFEREVTGERIRDKIAASDGGVQPGSRPSKSHDANQKSAPLQGANRATTITIRKTTASTLILGITSRFMSALPFHFRPSTISDRYSARASVTPSSSRVQLRENKAFAVIFVTSRPRLGDVD